jgi:hypothetical protein
MISHLVSIPRCPSQYYETPIARLKGIHSNSRVWFDTLMKRAIPRHGAREYGFLGGLEPQMPFSILQTLKIADRKGLNRIRNLELIYL